MAKKDDQSEGSAETVETHEALAAEDFVIPEALVKAYEDAQFNRVPEGVDVTLSIGQETFSVPPEAVATCIVAVYRPLSEKAHAARQAARKADLEKRRAEAEG